MLRGVLLFFIIGFGVYLLYFLGNSKLELKEIPPLFLDISLEKPENQWQPFSFPLLAKVSQVKELKNKYSTLNFTLTLPPGFKKGSSIKDGPFDLGFQNKVLAFWGKEKKEISLSFALSKIEDFEIKDLISGRSYRFDPKLQAFFSEDKREVLRFKNYKDFKYLIFKRSFKNCKIERGLVYHPKLKLIVELSSLDCSNSFFSKPYPVVSLIKSLEFNK